MTIGCCLGVGKDFLFLSLKMKGTLYSKNNDPLRKYFTKKIVYSQYVGGVHLGSFIFFKLFINTTVSTNIITEGNSF